MTPNIKSQDSTQTNAAHMTANQTTLSVPVLCAQHAYTITKPHAHTPKNSRHSQPSYPTCTAISSNMLAKWKSSQICNSRHENYFQNPDASV